MKNTELYKRQQTLNLTIPNNVLILGVGGIGSWAALCMALIGTPKITIIDADVVEEHNLNRTPFKSMHIGIDKVFAVADLITERRSDCEVIPLNVPFEVSGINPSGYDIVIDCTDTFACKDALVANDYTGKYIKLGYDGLSFTFDRSINSEVWGDAEGYRIVPSYAGSVLLINALLINAIATDYDIPSFSSDVKTILDKTMIPDVVKIDPVVCIEKTEDIVVATHEIEK